MPIDEQRKITKYIQVIKSIVSFHMKHYYPALKRCQGNIIEICGVVRAALQNQEFVDMYQMYAGYCQHAIPIIELQYSDTCSSIKDFNSTPLEHMKKVGELLVHLMNMLKDADDLFVSDEFKQVAATESQFSKYEKKVLNNVFVNSITTSEVSSRCSILSFCLIFFNYRILLKSTV